MKKQFFLALFMILAVLCTSFSAFAVAESIIINGNVAQIPADMGIIREKDERTFVPIRFVMEYLDCHVDYDETNRSATVASDTCAYLIQDGNNRLFVIPYPNAEGMQVTEPYAITMDTVPYIEETEGRMYIPIRFLAQAIGYTVGWDEETQTVTLSID